MQDEIDNIELENEKFIENLKNYKIRKTKAKP